METFLHKVCINRMSDYIVLKECIELTYVPYIQQQLKAQISCLSVNNYGIILCAISSCLYIIYPEQNTSHICPTQ